MVLLLCYLIVNEVSIQLAYTLRDGALDTIFLSSNAIFVKARHKTSKEKRGALRPVLT
jgi:hypothetical protein